MAKAHSHEKSAYVYAILVDGVVRYIGKGTGDRAYRHVQVARRLSETRAAGGKVRALYFHNKLAKAIRSGSVVDVVVLDKGLSDKQAFLQEIKYIAEYRSSADLWNKTKGGEGVSSTDAIAWWSASPSQRKKHSERMKALAAAGDAVLLANLAKGRSRQWSAEEKVRHAKMTASLWQNPGYRSAVLAVLARASTKRSERTGDMMRKRWRMEEYRSRMSVAVAASNQRRKGEIRSTTRSGIGTRELVEIKRLLGIGISQRKIAKKLSICQQTVSDINRGVGRWGYL